MSKSIFQFQQNIKEKDQIDLSRDLSILLRTGITLNEAVMMIRSQTRSSSLKKLLSEILLAVENGSNLSSALDKSNYRLKSVFVNLVKAGEASGSLSQNLSFISEWIERNVQLKRNIKSVTLYPKIVISAAFILGMFLSIFILPKLIPVFNSMSLELPLVTKIVLGAAVFFRDKSWVVVLAVLIAIVLYRIIVKVVFTRRILQRFYLSTPFFGNLIKSYELALFSQLMAVLLKSGLTINQAFDVAGSETRNVPYNDSFIKIRDRLIQGVSLSESIKNFEKLYANNYSSIILVGEKTGTLEESFRNLSDYYNKDIQSRTKDLPTVIEPILLLVIGIIVGVIALSIILPIYELSSGLQ